MKRKFVGHHGDLGFFRLNKLPKDAKFITKAHKYIAQEGETTGHKHVITSSQEFDIYEIERQLENGETVKRWLYLLNAPAEIGHEEHVTRTLEPGIYEQDQELEESAQDGLIRQVID
jgi:hypothetical protein